MLDMIKMPTSITSLKLKSFDSWFSESKSLFGQGGRGGGGGGGQGRGTYGLSRGLGTGVSSTTFSGFFGRLRLYGPIGIPFVG